MPDHEPDHVPTLPSSLEADVIGRVAVLRLRREHKRNAIDDVTVAGIDQFFSHIPAGVGAVVLDAAGDHFSAGLDLSALGELSTFEGVAHSASWHRIFQKIEFGPVPVVAALKGAVIGGGLELAAAAHLRVADSTAFYALPEGQRGIFVGGGASVRVPRLIGTHRVADMMLTGRVLTADEGHAFGISDYLTEPGGSFARAMELAEKICSNAPVTNYAVVHVLPRIAQSNPTEGYVMESLIAAIAQGTDEAKHRMRTFLEGRAPRVTEPGSQEASS
ncbi:MAG: crotonase/enoyl-CoA hydratase family protein [Ilumatobacteraceae bacterium]